MTTKAASPPIAASGPSNPITRMDSASTEQWRELGAVQRGSSPADRVIEALRCLDKVKLGFPVSQLTHCLQTATRAERAGADTDMVIGSLCHDVGKVLPGTDHAAIAGQMLRPYVRPEVAEVIRAHWAFQLRYTSPSIPGSSPEMRQRYRRKPWYPLAEQFADLWDQASFDPDYDTFPLEHFEDRIREVFGRPRREPARAGMRGRARRAASRLKSRIGV